MKRMMTIACLLAGAVLLAGCPKKATTVQPPTAGSQVGGSSTSPNGGASTSGSDLGGDNANRRGGAGEATGPLARKGIYVDFDKTHIKPQDTAIVKLGAPTLTARPGLTVKLAGNND